MKKLHNFGSVFLIVVLFGFFQSCSLDDGGAENKTTTEFQLEMQAPENIQVISFDNLTLNFQELNSGAIKTESISNNNIWSGTVLSGTYRISVEGEITYSLEGQPIKGKVSAVISSQPIFTDLFKTKIRLFLTSDQTDLIIEEIFFTGNLTPQGKQYLGDRYFKIYNNSNKVVYADGLLLAQSAFQSDDKQSYTPDIMPHSVAVSAIIMLPGTGKQYPIKPGQHIIIAEDGINHKEYNANSIDLRKADFEIYHENADDVDNHAVPNAIELYSKFVIENRGSKSYFLARLPEGITKEDFLSKYSYTYSYDFIFDGEVYPMDDEAYSIPNTWILDAVNLGIVSDFKWLVVAPSLDMGWTYCSKIESDNTRYGKSVRRKTVSTNASGIKILKDTNNSTLDFDAAVRPSLMN